MPPKKAPKKVEIVYPPVPRKKWIPPDQRPKPPKPPPAYVKPKGMNQPLKLSSLLKIWHAFVLCGPNKYVLPGSFSQTHRRFRLKTSGNQGSCNCVVACMMASLFKMENWNFNTINQILSIGDSLYEKSIAKIGDKSLGDISVRQVYPNFFIHRSMVTFQIPNATEPFKLDTTPEQDPVVYFGKIVTEFFATHNSGVAKVDRHHIALWRYQTAYFLFDSTDHQKDGKKWDGLAGTGFSICIRFPKLQSVAAYIVADNYKGKIMKIRIWPVELQRCQETPLKAPENLEDIKRITEEQEKIKKLEKEIPPKQGFQLKVMKKAGASETSIGKKKSDKSIRKAEEVSPDIEIQAPSVTMVRKLGGRKIPVEPRITKSITHFTIYNDDKMGIIRATTHQMDKKFSRFRDGEQSLSQAVAALVMRRSFPTRQWIRKFVNDILKLGETIHHKSLKEIPDGPFKLSSITKKIEHPPGEYALEFEELAVLGKLESDRQGVLDLLPALMTFLKTYDCCIINGPSVLAVWNEDNRYYMFDPNERDDKGRILIDKKEQEPGVACVTWFTSLRDLVKLYIDNIPKEHKRDDFSLSKVTVVDYVGVTENWSHFKGLVNNKWILRGTISQNSHVFSTESRNTQCTANATMAIAFVHVRQPQEWSKKTIDQVLMSGDEFYRGTVNRLVENNRLVSRLLMIDELDRKFSFSNKEVSFEINDCCVNGILGYPDQGDVLNIKTGLQKFFDEYDYGVLTCRSISVAIWKKDGAYYYFDSHSRDHKGVSAGYGTACVIRVLNVQDLAKAIECNLRPDKVSFFNISAVTVRILEAGEDDGMVRQPLNHYRQSQDNENVAILSAKSSNKDPKFEFNAGKQTVPMCVTAMGMNKLRPSPDWNEETLQTILDFGHTYFEESMAEYEASTEEVEEDKGITSKNLKKDFKIGLNKIEVELEQLAEGFVEDGLEQAITTFYTTVEETTEPDNQEILVETENITVSMWKDPNLFYIFDPYPRDANGQVIGKDSWSAKYEPEVAAVPEGDAGAAAQPPVPAPAAQQGGGDQVALVDEIEERPKRPRSSGEGVFEEDTASMLDSDVNGKACILFFYNLEDAVKHIIENTRPNSRSMMPFTITKVNLKNTPMVKEVYNNDFGERIDVYSGNWHSFVEMDHGHWILRGQVDLNNEMFPAENRGKQELPCILMALAFAKLYPISIMEAQHITSILRYGDRLLTFIKRKRMKELKENTALNLLEDEIKAIMKNETYEFEAYPGSFVIGDFRVYVTIKRNFLTGDITAKTVLEVLDVKRGLDELFKTSKYGILECKGYIVAVWKGETVCYMFDPHKTGVTGAKSLIGYPSITRFRTTDLLADIYLQNIPKDGHNTFYIHQVKLRDEQFQRPKDAMEEIGASQPLKISGFTEIIPGKSILRGGISQEDPKFDKGSNNLSAPVAYVALTMSLIHKPQTWSKPIVDEVITVADELYTQTMMQGRLNPWEDTIDPFTVAQDFRVGVMHANCQLRNSDQTGIFDLKQDSTNLNLRQCLERFFIDNTHGILYSPPNICYAIWEVEMNNQAVIYLCDPNKRGPTGLPAPHGTACVVTFGSAKLAAEHIISCLSTPEEKEQQFTIIPVEIAVGPFKTSKKTKTKAKPIPDTHQTIMKKIAHHAVVEEKKAAKKKAIEQQKKEECKRKYWQARNGYFNVSKGQYIVRGTRGLTSPCYQEKTRGFQDIPVCIVSFVANFVVPITEWTWKEIDAILDTGDQLYIDSYIAYNPRDKKLGLENIVRNIFIMNNKAHVTIYKPITMYGFRPNELTRNFEKWFLDEHFCMLNYMDQYVGVFFKKGYYFLFDPREMSPSGCRGKSGQDTGACVMRFERLDDLAAKLINNLLPAQIGPDEEVEEAYDLVLVRLEGGICQCP